MCCFAFCCRMSQVACITAIHIIFCFLLQDEPSSLHYCNPHHVLLYGVGRIRYEAQHTVKKMTKEICKLFSKKFSIDVAEGKLHWKWFCCNLYSWKQRVNYLYHLFWLLNTWYLIRQFVLYDSYSKQLFFWTALFDCSLSWRHCVFCEVWSVLFCII